MAEPDAKKKALSLLERRDYGSEELRRKLVEKGFDEADAESAVSLMVEYGFINDESYACAVARHYAAKGCGRARVKEELRRRYVPRELWETALDELPEQDGTVEALLRSRLRGKEDDPDAVRRASAALLRRGFSYDEVRRGVEKIKAGEDYSE